MRARPEERPGERLVRRIALALQGGGAHGAFTWGALDRLSQEDDLDIAAISGTSSGAINAAVYAYGSMVAGAEGARDALHRLWHGVSKAGHPWSEWMSRMAAVVGPYQYPLYLNPLVGILSEIIDFDDLRKCEAPHIFVCATNVRTNQRKVFGGKDIKLDTLLASACLPQLFRAVEIDGEFYWDGGYMGNPVLSPLLRHSSDVLIVQVNPFLSPDIPKTPREISERVNELGFNSSLVHEVNTISAITKLIEFGDLVSSRFRPIHFHKIAAEPVLKGSKNDTRWNYLLSLHQSGWKAADDWINDPNRFGKVGKDSSINVTSDLLGPLWGSLRNRAKED